MKLKEGFVLRKIAGEDVVIPIGNNIADFNGLVRLNQSAAFLWKALQKETTKDELIKSLIEEYKIDRELATNDVEQFINTLKQNEIIEGI